MFYYFMFVNVAQTPVCVPFISINGQPFLLINIFESRFVILGNVFWPQDFFLLALTLIVFFVFIIFFTVVFGRLWCGWACPQTLFMEMVFRKIEYWIEGDANQQRKLDKAPWTGKKIRKKTLKHAIFIVIAILISHTVMAYLIGIDEVRSLSVCFGEKRTFRVITTGRLAAGLNTTVKVPNPAAATKTRRACPR